MHDQNLDIESILVTEEEIKKIVERVAAEIDRDYDESGHKLLLLAILKGSVAFMGDLMKAIRRPAEIDFMRVSSYGRSTTSSGKVNILLDLHRMDLADCDIIIVEDIVDSGITLSYLTEYLKLKGAHSIRCATLLDKPDRRKTDFHADYVGAVIPDKFVVGYGLDYDERYRTLPYVGILKPEIYETNTTKKGN